MARPKKSPQAVADTRQSLLDTAQELYERGGIDAMSFRAIADAAGCSHSKLYSYFESKADIIDALRLLAYELLHDRLSRAAATGNDPLASLLSLSEAYIELGLGRPQMYGLLYTNAGKMGEDDPRLLEAKSAALRVCSEVIEAASATGAIELAVDPLTAAHIFWSGAHGLVELQLGGFLVVGRTIEDLSSDLFSVMIGGLGPRSP